MTPKIISNHKDEEKIKLSVYLTNGSKAKILPDSCNKTTLPDIKMHQCKVELGQ